jgi:hypothetical protein
MVDYRTAIDLKSNQLLARVKGCASRPNCRPTLDPVSALAVNCVGWMFENTVSFNASRNTLIMIGTVKGMSTFSKPNSP